MAGIYELARGQDTLATPDMSDRGSAADRLRKCVADTFSSVVKEDIRTCVAGDRVTVLDSRN